MEVDEGSQYVVVSSEGRLLHEFKASNTRGGPTLRIYGPKDP